MTSAVSESERCQIQGAIEAIGAYQETGQDYKLEPSRHASELETNAAFLREILEHDAEIQKIHTQYDKLDVRANGARRWFEFCIQFFGVVLVAAPLYLMFVISVPLQLPEPLRWGLAIVTSVVLAALLSSVANLVSAFLNLRKLPKRLYQTMICLMWGTTLVVLLYFGYHYLVPWFFSVPAGRPEQELQMLRFGVIVSGLTLVAAYAFGFRFWRKWFEARGQAESLRRGLFMEVLNATHKSVETFGGERADDRSTVLCHVLEYFRRYQIEMQQRYYEGKGRSNMAGADRADTTRIWVFRIGIAALAVLVLIHIGGRLEQSNVANLEWFSAISISISLYGGEELVLLMTLTAFGIWFILLLRTTLLKEKLTAARYVKTSAELRRLAGAEPNEANLELVTLPLTAARVAAVRGNKEQVEQFMREVNLLLASEVGQWSHDMSYDIMGGRSPRVVANRILSADHDFDMLIRDLKEFNCIPFKAIKTAPVSARQVQHEEEIVTHFDGLETKNIAEPGDWVVTNMDAGGQIIRDVQCHTNTYIIREDKFSQLYQSGKGVTEFGEIYRPQNEAFIEALYLAGGFDIVAPWGERQRTSTGFLVRKAGEVYGIHSGAFGQTYQRIDSEGAR